MAAIGLQQSGQKRVLLALLFIAVAALLCTLWPDSGDESLFTGEVEELGPVEETPSKTTLEDFPGIEVNQPTRVVKPSQAPAEPEAKGNRTLVICVQSNLQDYSQREVSYQLAYAHAPQDVLLQEECNQILSYTGKDYAYRSTGFLSLPDEVDLSDGLYLRLFSWQGQVEGEVDELSGPNYWNYFSGVVTLERGVSHDEIVGLLDSGTQLALDPKREYWLIKVRPASGSCTVEVKLNPLNAFDRIEEGKYTPEVTYNLARLLGRRSDRPGDYFQYTIEDVWRKRQADDGQWNVTRFQALPTGPCLIQPLFGEEFQAQDLGVALQDGQARGALTKEIGGEATRTLAVFTPREAQVEIKEGQEAKLSFDMSFQAKWQRLPMTLPQSWTDADRLMVGCEVVRWRDDFKERPNAMRFPMEDPYPGEETPPPSEWAKAYGVLQSHTWKVGRESRNGYDPFGHALEAPDPDDDYAETDFDLDDKLIVKHGLFFERNDHPTGSYSVIDDENQLWINMVHLREMARLDAKFDSQSIYRIGFHCGACEIISARELIKLFDSDQPKLKVEERSTSKAEVNIRMPDPRISALDVKVGWTCEPIEVTRPTPLFHDSADMYHEMGVGYFSILHIPKGYRVRLTSVTVKGSDKKSYGLPESAFKKDGGAEYSTLTVEGGGKIWVDLVAEE